MIVPARKSVIAGIIPATANPPWTKPRTVQGRSCCAPQYRMRQIGAPTSMSPAENHQPRGARAGGRTERLDDRKCGNSSPSIGVPVVPVTPPAQIFRQRRRGRGHDAPSGLEGQRLERDQGTDSRLAVRCPGRCSGTPTHPSTAGCRARPGAGRAVRPALMRGHPGQHERDPLAGRDGEGGIVGEAVAGQRDRRGQPEGVGAAPRPAGSCPPAAPTASPGRTRSGSGSRRTRPPTRTGLPRCAPGPAAYRPGAA